MPTTMKRRTNVDTRGLNNSSNDGTDAEGM
jgi:hypothetical protein